MISIEDKMMVANFYAKHMRHKQHETTVTYNKRYILTADKYTPSYSSLQGNATPETALNLCSFTAGGKDNYCQLWFKTEKKDLRTPIQVSFFRKAFLGCPWLSA